MNVTRLEGSRVVAVIVAYFPSPGLFARLIESLLGDVHTILVVDNGRGGGLETLPSSDLIERIDMNGNAGIAAAQNTGIRRALSLGATHVLLLDHDSVPGTDMVERLLTISLRLQASGKRLAAVGADYRDSRHASNHPFVSMGWGGYDRIEPQPNQDVVPVRFLIGAGTLIGRDAFDAVGLMEERLFIDYVDVEWCLRAASTGWHCFGVPGARLEHRLGDEPLTWGRLGPAIRIRGRTLPSRSPLRHYYLFRNGIWLMRRGDLPLHWKLLEAKRLVACFGLFALFAERRFEQVASMLRGMRDGARGRMGAFPASAASASSDPA